MLIKAWQVKFHPFEAVILQYAFSQDQDKRKKEAVPHQHTVHKSLSELPCRILLLSK